MDRASIVAATRGTDAIVSAVNPLGYRNWSQLVLPMIEKTIAAAKDRGAYPTTRDDLQLYGLDALPILKEDSPLRHQNQPPDGSSPLRRRYVTRLP
jgi:hypothetical protein